MLNSSRVDEAVGLNHGELTNCGGDIRMRINVARLTRGAISLSSTTHFHAYTVLERGKPGGVAARPCQLVENSRASIE
jgi:hypothetical protein